MAVQFKFRSSVKFDSVDIERRTSISVRDLKAKIIRHKNLDICQDSDLVFSDAISGQEYTNENIQIPCGSSVIIKRVPAGSVHVDVPHFNSYQNLHSKDSGNAKSHAPLNVETVDFDDFGVDLYPGPEATVFGSDLDADKYTFRPGYEPNTGITRCLEPAVGGCEKLEASGLSDAIPGSHSHGGVEQNIPQTKSEPEVQEDLNVEKMGSGDPLDKKHADLPSEMKCSLCNSSFKEAVMIPCCQHSFCEKCIRQVLLEKARCPKCLSIKSRVEDLLPNISLRQAIEHFLESQNVITVPDNAFCQYAPDGESGIQAKDVFCGGTILQRELELPHSPETGMASNNWLAESASNPPFKKDATYHFGARNIQTFPPSLHKNNQIDGETHSTRLVPDGSAALDDFQGENMPMHEEAKPASKKKRPPWVYTAGGDKSFLETGRHRKGDRTCYMCGSPDHFIRECPVASSPRPMLHAGNAIFPGSMPGYVPPYWDGALLPHALPFRNLYRNHGMTAFDTMLIPCAPFSVPPFLPSMYRSIPGFGGYMAMGGVAPLPGTGEDCYISHSEFLDLQCQEKRRKLSKENLRRDQSLDDDDDDWERHHYNETARLQEHKSCANRENNVSYSSDGNMHSVDGHRKSSRLEVGHRDEKLYHHTEKSSLDIDDMPSSSSWHSEEKHKHYHRTSRNQNERREQCGSDYSVEKHKYYHKSSRNQKDRRKQCGSDSSRSHHQNTSEKDDKIKRIQHDFKKRQKHHSNSGSGLEHSVSNDKKLQKGSSHNSRKSKHNVKSNDKKLQKGSSHNSRKSKHNVKSNVDERSHDRWKMVSGSDEDSAEDYRYCKRKRVQ